MKVLVILVFALLCSVVMAKIRCRCRCRLRGCSCICRWSALTHSSGSVLNIYSRNEWNAVAPVYGIQDTKIPVKNIVLTQTLTPSCFSLNECAKIVKGIQGNQMHNHSLSDIGYNFLVGGDGNIYAGRGWDKVGTHTNEFSSESLGIALIGSFDNQIPETVQLNATKMLLDYAVDLGKLNPEFKLHGNSKLIDINSEFDDDED